MEQKQEQATFEKIPLTWDYAFKNVFGKYGNEDILKRFLSVILKENITKVVIQNGELEKETKDEKLGRLDIRVEINNKYLADVEMQVENKHNISERTMYYLSKLYSGQINQGEKYEEMKKTIVIAILDFSYYNRAEYHSIAHMKFEKNNNEEERVEKIFKGAEQELVTDKLEYHVIDLKRFKDKQETTGELADWINLILGEMGKIKMRNDKNDKIEELEKAVKVVEELEKDPETRELYRLRKKGEFERRMDMAGAYKEGIQERRKKETRRNSKENAK